MEAAECGLACVAVAAAMLGSKIDLPWLRQRYAVSSRGASLKGIIEVASSIGMSGRAVRCELDELGELRTPAILHWGLNHFVVLEKVDRRGIRIFDPAVGHLTVPRGIASESFTGVAVELIATRDFQRRVETSPLKLSSLFSWTPQVRGGLAQALLLSLLMQFYLVGSPYYLQVAVDEVVAKGDGGLLLALAIGFGLFGLLNAGAEMLRAVVLQRMASLLSWDMTQRVFHHMVRLPLHWFQRRRLADVQSRFQALDPVKNLIANGLVAAVIDGSLSVVTLVMMLIYAPVLCLVAVAGLAVYVGVRLGSIPLGRRYAADSLSATIAEQGKRLEMLRAIQTIKVMGGEAQRESEWANSFAQTVRQSQKSVLLSSGIATGQRLIEAIVHVVVVYLAIMDILAAKMTIGAMYAFLAYRSQFLARSVSLVENITNWRLLDIYTHRVADVVLSPTEVVGPSIGSAGPILGKLELRNVGFQYAPAERFVFRNVNCVINAGEMVAVVAPSGTGKSTLLKLICGLYPPSQGEILLDDTPMNGVGLSVVRRSLGVVLQDDELLPGSIADNICFFDEQPDIDRIWRCVQIVCLSDEVKAMPMRLDTFVGDMGSALSGGQKQRILLARALYRQPRILVLDEATSHLDVPTEEKINRELEALEITRVIVAHRPDTIKRADRIFQVHAGGVVELRVSRDPATKDEAPVS